MKTCTKCGQEKPLGEFYKQKGSKDGLRSHCKVCYRKYRQEYYIRNIDKWEKYNVPKRKQLKTVVCLHCNVSFEVSAKKSNYKHIYCEKPECQEANNQRKLRFYKENNRKNRAKLKSYREKKTAERKSRLANRPVWTGKNCVDCGKPVKIYYPGPAHEGIYYRRCKECRQYFDYRVNNINTDFLESWGAI